MTVRLLAPPHSSTKVALEGPWDIFQRDTIDATELALKAARDCSVPVFVLCSTEGALLGDHNLINADETTVLSPPHVDHISHHLSALSGEPRWSLLQGQGYSGANGACRELPRVPNRLRPASVRLSFFVSSFKSLAAEVSLEFV